MVKGLSLIDVGHSGMRVEAHSIHADLDCRLHCYAYHTVTLCAMLLSQPAGSLRSVFAPAESRSFSLPDLDAPSRCAARVNANDAAVRVSVAFLQYLSTCKHASLVLAIVHPSGRLSIRHMVLFCPDDIKRITRCSPK